MYCRPFHKGKRHLPSSVHLRCHIHRPAIRQKMIEWQSSVLPIIDSNLTRNGVVETIFNFAHESDFAKTGRKDVEVSDIVSIWCVANDSFAILDQIFNLYSFILRSGRLNVEENFWQVDLGPFGFMRKIACNERQGVRHNTSYQSSIGMLATVLFRESHTVSFFRALFLLVV